MTSIVIKIQATIKKGFTEYACRTARIVRWGAVKIIDYTQTHIDDANKLPISTYIN